MTSKVGQILIVATLNSKGAEVAYLREGLIARGREICVLDVGTAGEPSVPADISREEVSAHAEGFDKAKSASEKLAAMSYGAKAIVSEMLSAGSIDAVVGIGGGKGTGVFNEVVRDLPFGFPKVLVTSARPAMIGEIATTSDTILFPTLVDLFGLNTFTRLVLDNAVNAIAGLAWSPPIDVDELKVAITAFGVTTPAVNEIKNILEEAGIATVVFPANGAGGRALEALIAKNAFAEVIDLTTTELADLLLGGTASAGETRLTAAGIAGIPQVVAPGATDMVNFGSPESLPAEFGGRLTYRHTPMTTLVRTTPEETAEIARMTARRLNKARGPVAVFWPSQGVSDYDRQGHEFFDPAANKAWRRALVENLESRIHVYDVDNHINDPAFAARCANWMIDQLNGNQ